MIRNSKIYAVDQEAAVELDEHLIFPLPSEPGGNNQQNSTNILSPLKTCEKEPDLNRLSETYVIRNDPIRLAGFENLVNKRNLVGKRINIEAIKRTSGFVPTFERVRNDVQSGPLRGLVVCRFSAFEPQSGVHDPSEAFKRKPNRLTTLMKLHQCLLTGSQLSGFNYRSDT